MNCNATYNKIFNPDINQKGYVPPRLFGKEVNQRISAIAATILLGVGLLAVGAGTALLVQPSLIGTVGAALITGAGGLTVLGTAAWLVHLAERNNLSKAERIKLLILEQTEGLNKHYDLIFESKSASEELKNCLIDSMRGLGEFGLNIHEATSQSVELFKKESGEQLQKLGEERDKIAPNDPLYEDVSEVYETIKYFNKLELDLAQEGLRRKNSAASQDVD